MKCFYHNDMDGRCAGAIVAQYTGNRNREDYFEVDYVMDLPLDKISYGEQVWFVDYSFKENTKYVLDKLKKLNCRITWIDHHTSSINLEKQYPELQYIDGFRMEGVSGAALTYMYCYNKKRLLDVPYHIKLVSDYDCWKYKYEPDTTYFKLGIEMYKYDSLDQIWTELIDTTGCTTQKIIEVINKGKSIKSYIDKDNTYYREHFSYETEIAGHTCLVVNKKTNSWVFGKKYNEYPLVMVWVFDGTRYTYSIFSSNE